MGKTVGSPDISSHGLVCNNEAVTYRRARGRTLIEVLVVVAIFAVLAALLVAAVQTAREDARQQQCRNNLKQLVLACLNHETVTKRFPTGGWGFAWTGDPDWGFGQTQPGGWLYNTGPFAESQSWHDLGAGQANVAAKNAANLERLEDVVYSLWCCPTRRRCATLPWRNPWGIVNAGVPKTVERTDYAANGGDYYTSAGAPKAPLWESAPPGIEAGPASLAEGGVGGSKGRIARAEKTFANVARAATGMIYCGSLIRLADVTNGAETTYLLGEKAIDADYYTTGQDLGDRFAALVGDCPDVSRWTFLPPVPDLAGYCSPWRFGSAHPAGFNMGFCNGAVKLTSFAIDPDVHRRLGNCEAPGHTR